jgi:hypothetical protein
MSHRTGIWIDHERAVIVSASEGRVTTEILKSHVAGHPRYGGQQDGGGEKKYEERHGQHLERYYDEVIRHLTDAAELLIFGPGEAKRELERQVRRSKAHPVPTIDIETSDKLTDPQIVARVKEHFGIDR